MLTLQVYCPASAKLTSLSTTLLVYNENDFITRFDISIEPCGEDHKTCKSTGTSTAGCSSTIHSSIGDKPDRMGLGALDIRSMFGWVTADKIRD